MMVWLSVVAVSLSCFVASAIVDCSMNMTFSRPVLLDGGASPGLLVCWSWVAGANPISFISEQWTPKVPLLFGGVKVSIFHCAWLVYGVELSFFVRFWPVCWYSFTAFLENVTAVSKCILSFSL